MLFHKLERFSTSRQVKKLPECGFLLKIITHLQYNWCDQPLNFRGLEAFFFAFLLRQRTFYNVLTHVIFFAKIEQFTNFRRPLGT